LLLVVVLVVVVVLLLDRWTFFLNFYDITSWKIISSHFFGALIIYHRKLKIEIFIP
jgi:hypothetical protein